jgi:FrmR/RcnR family transcriptional regulator, repressor of frmRAB operon
MIANTPPSILAFETTQRKAKLVNRVRRIIGQIDAMERGIKHDSSCTDVLQLSSAARGALDGLLSELIERHVRVNIVESQQADTVAEAAEDLVDVVRSYLK